MSILLPSAVLSALSSRQRPLALEVTGPITGGRVHRWLAPPLQSQLSSWVPQVVLELGSSRHLPDCGLSSSPFAWGTQVWLAPPLQPHRSTSVPSAVDPAPTTSRHMPLFIMTPLP